MQKNGKWKITLNKEYLQKNRERKLLFLGVCFGIIGNLLANIIESFSLKNIGYPLWYISLIFVLFVICMLLLLKTYLRWKWLIFRGKKLLKQAEKTHKKINK